MPASVFPPAPMDDLIEAIEKGTYKVVHKFGLNSSAGTSFAPVASGGIYQTPQVSGATTLRVKSGGNSNDTAAGTGARKVMLEGLDETGAEVTEELTLAGTSASSASSTTFLRLFRAWVSESGTYATASAGSHSADIDIENGSGGTDWATIRSTGFPRSQTEIGAYSVPLGYTAYVQSVAVFSDSSKTTNFIFFQRQNILETAAPYTAMREVFKLYDEGGEETLNPRYPLGPFPALTDIGFMAKVDTGSAEVDADFEIILVPSS